MFRCVDRVALALACVLAGCHHGSDEKAGEETSAKPPRVKVLAVARTSFAPDIPVAGVLAPLPGKDVKVGALAAGRVDRLFVAEGDRVKAGQPLAHVEARPLEEHVAESAAARESARAAVENARTRYARAEKLWKDGVSARQEVDDAKAGLIAAESGLKQAEATGGIAAVNLDRATIRAPLDGIVAAILTPAGQPVDGNGQPVVEIADTRVLDLRAPVPAGRLADVVVGMKAQLEVEGFGRRDAMVEAIAPIVDAATGTVIVRVKVPNADGRLRGGMYATGRLSAAPRDALIVPTSALLPGDGGAANVVAIVDGHRDGGEASSGKIAHRTLELGARSGDGVEVRAGLAPGERVVVEGGYALPDDAEVEVAP